MAKWKVMRKSTCWARSLPFSHIITEIDLSFPLLPARALSKLRDTTFEMHVCFCFETCTLLLSRPCDSLTCCISFFKKSPPNCRVITDIFLLMRALPLSLISANIGRSGDGLIPQPPPAGCSRTTAGRLTAIKQEGSVGEPEGRWMKSLHGVCRRVQSLLC